MPRKTVIALLIFFTLFAGVCDAGMPFSRRNRDGSRGGGPFPGAGDVVDLSPEGKTKSYQPDSLTEFYGDAANRYLQYGLLKMESRDYLYGGPKDRVNIEIATMESPTAAAGLYHFHRGKLLEGAGKPLDIGAEAVLDVKRDSRNLYFYRGAYFIKIVYSGKGRPPDLTPIARYIDDHMPAKAKDEKPQGFEYIDIDGINKDTIALTPGFTFNISFLPPSVWASAPGGGSPASDLYIITRLSDNDAAELQQDYTAFLRLHAEYFEEYKVGSMKLTKGIDPNQGRVVFGAYRNALIIAARPDGYVKGEALIEQVMDRIDEVRGEGKRPRKKRGDDDDDGDGERRGWNPFRRRK